MKILWIEDFGGGLIPSAVVIEMFKGLIPEKIYDSEYDQDEDVSLELPRLFKKHTIHQIIICKSYMEWQKTYTEQGLDFDIILIDINLEAYKTPISHKPIEHIEFDKKAGFYIYNLLIKEGYPDDNIAFFTGEEVSLKEFMNYCGEILLETPKNTFEKNPDDFNKLRKWIDKKIKTKYLILRRGVIDGCKFIMDGLSKIPEQELIKFYLFHKTTSLKIEENPQMYREEIIDYMIKLGRFLPLRQPLDKNHYYFLFIKELVAKWEQSKGYFNRDRVVFSESRIEDKFKKNCQIQMKILRNWTVHHLISNKISEKEVAYLFMLSIRSWIDLSFSEIFPYENILAKLFDKLNEDEIENEINTYLEIYLKQTYKSLKNKFMQKAEFKPYGYDFISLLKSFGELPERIEGDLSEVLREEIRKISLQLLYQSFWHGLFPSWLEQDKLGLSTSTNFDIEPLEKNTFAYYLGKLIFLESFK